MVGGSADDDADVRGSTRINKSPPGKVPKKSRRLTPTAVIPLSYPTRAAMTDAVTKEVPSLRVVTRLRPSLSIIRQLHNVRACNDKHTQHVFKSRRTLRRRRASKQELQNEKVEIDRRLFC